MNTGEPLLRALERETEVIADPVAKLRHLRGSISRYRRTDRLLRLIPIPGVHRMAQRMLGYDSVDPLLGHSSLSRAVARKTKRHRPAWLGFAVVGALLAASLFAAARWSTRDARAARAAAPVLAGAPRLDPVAEPMPASSAPAPKSIWLVERGANFEQYSNGLRIETNFAVAGPERRYRVFRRTGMQRETYTRPVGILFHTSESDIWPLEESFNDNLKKSSHGLMKYIARRRLYNYVIDRFGRVYRIVEENGRANHAGFSVWKDGDTTFLNLNNAFIGVCFETRWEGGRALPITQAQLASGLALTEHLRLRYEIAPQMCVTHGLTSVNSREHLIGHHVDWARGFPFGAFGLPNAYDVPSPAVLEFGFHYDDEFLAKMQGEPWPGVASAEQALVAEARQTGESIEALRLRKRAMYDRWILEQTKAGAQEVSARKDEVGVASGG